MMKTHGFVTLSCILFAMLALSCGPKKAGQMPETTEAKDTTAQRENILKLSLPQFKKFVEVTAEEAFFYKSADISSPTLVLWEEDCLEGERDEDSGLYLWSDQPGRPGYEKDTNLAFKGNVVAVLGEEGDFYQMYLFDKTITSVYIPKSDVRDIESAPVTAENIEDSHWGGRGTTRMLVKDGPYQDILLYTVGGEVSFTCEELHVGILIDGVVAEPDDYYIDCRFMEEQQEPLVVEEDGHIFLDYNGEMGEQCELNLKKLSTEHIAKIVEIVKKKSPKCVEYTYRFPTAEIDDVTFFQVKLTK